MKTLVNQYTFASILIDTSNLAYSLISPYLVKCAGLQCLSISPWRLEGVTEESGTIKEVARLTIDIESYKDTIWGYVSPLHPGYDLILGRTWINKRQVTIAPSKRSIYIYIYFSHQRICLTSTKNCPIPWDPSIKQTNAAADHFYIQHSKADQSIQVFAASLGHRKGLGPK
jgi:hypothetical protein